MLKKDIVIVGGGMVGLMMALALARSKFRIAVIESADPKKFTDRNFDGRVSAITKNSSYILDSIGVWQKIEKDAQPILDIHISDSDTSVFIDYEEELAGNEPMGFIVENRFIRQALLTAAKSYENIDYLAPRSVCKLDAGSNFAEVTLDNGQTIRAKLVIAADGKNSAVRKMAGIETVSWNYPQDGIVCTIKHERNHNAEARERFLPAGPFAILPMKGGHHSSLVWTEDRKLTKFFMEMDKEEFTRQVKLRFGDYLGDLEVVEPRFSFPLSMSFAENYFANRVTLAGDAAHAIHPVAGQGLNMGIKDVAMLTEVVERARELGLDIGKKSVLIKYEMVRRPDNLLMTAVTDNLNRLFSNRSATIKLARNLGMAAVNKMPAVKKFFMKHAMGEIGYKPKLAKKN